MVPDPDLGPEQLCDPCFDRIDKQMAPIERILNDTGFQEALAEHAGYAVCEPTDSKSPKTRKAPQAPGGTCGAQRREKPAS